MIPFSLIALLLTAASSPSGLPCDEGALQLRADFAGARAADCRRTDSGFAVTISPESVPVNKSAWYAFDIVSEAVRPVTVEMSYSYGWHRYRPKIRTRDGGWQVLAEEAVETHPQGKRAVLTFKASEGRTRIAAQPRYDADERMAWVEELASGTSLTLSIAGQSVEGRPIQRLSSVPEGGTGPLVLLLGSQHPPEVPGWVAMQAFLERLTEEDALARMFREKVRVETFPVLNPDGLDKGYWRLNAALVDTNRDWGAFTQPETRLVRDAVKARVVAGDTPVLMVDFHATRKGDILYTPDETVDLTPAGYPEAWAAAIEARLQEASFESVPAHNPDLPTSKGWFAETYGAPGITLEIGDRTDPARSRRLGRAAAEAMMETLLEHTESRLDLLQEDE